MHAVKRILCIALLCPTIIAGWATVAGANSGADNGAAAVNTKDDTSIARFAFKITRDVDEVADEKNIAFAWSSCERCQTVAAAVQVVLIMSDPVEVSTQNLAFAINFECSSCRTLGSAYQFVMTTNGPVHFTDAGSASIERIRDESEAVVKSGNPIEEIQARLDVLMDELEQVLETELRASGSAGQIFEQELSKTAA